MIQKWSKKGHDAPWILNLDHGVWAIASGGEIAFELRYVARDAQGRLPTVPLAVGDFSSPCEAMMAVDLYDRSECSQISEDYVQALLSDTDSELILRAPGRVRFVLRRSSDGVCLGLGRMFSKNDVIAVLRSPSIGSYGGITHARPPGYDIPTETDIRVMAQIFEVRRARRSVSPVEPVGEDEYQAWVAENTAGRQISA